MHPIATAALVGALLFPVPPLLPGLSTESPSADRATVPYGAQAPTRPRAVWPLDPKPEVVRGFEPPSGPWAAGHRGVDLLGAPDEQVRAALAGHISFAGTLAGRGVVVVEHGSYRTTYEPVQPTVHRGDAVATGQVIGTLQSGLSHCAPRTCLHWGLIEGTTYQDPLTLIGGGPVRLLPYVNEPQARGWARW
jgi:murein DD-endopeptidase MepM/ murein hydrolase activator NlpD